MADPLCLDDVLGVYTVCGLAFESTVPFQGLPYSYDKPDAQFCLVGESSFRWPAQTTWKHRAVLPDGRAWPAFGVFPGGYVFHFEEVCRFVVSSSASVEAAPDRNSTVDVAQRLFVDQVVPLILQLKGRECLHASAVLTSRGVCALVGPSGAGKSTLAAALALAGSQLMCDDAVAIQETPGQMLVMPGHRGSKIWPDSAEALVSRAVLPNVAGHGVKKMLVLPDTVIDPAPLQRIYILAPASASSAPQISSATPQEILPALLEATFRIDISDSGLLARQFRFLGRLAASVPIRRLTYPHNFAALSSVCQCILEDAAL